MCIVIFMMKTRTDAMHVVKVVSRQKGREYVSYLLRNSYREGGKVRKQTLANLSHLPEPLIDLIRGWLRGERYLESGAALAIVRSLPHGHGAAVLGMLRFLGLETLLDRRPSRSRDLAVALIVARLVSPCSKLATARTLGQSTLGALLGVEGASADELYGALDWLLARQARVERSLARRHLSDGSLVLYDLTSTYVEGRCCALAAHGHSRDQRPDRAQIEFGLVTDARGCPIAVEAFAGRAADPATVEAQIEKLRERFGLTDVVLVGDRGMLTSARIERLREVGGIGWVSCLRAPAIRALVAAGDLQLSLFDERNLAEITSPELPGERLVVCRNPALAVVRTSVSAERLDACAVVETYKRLAAVERAFRGLKSVELAVRPIFHYREDRVRAHLFLCFLAYYVRWHLEVAWAPLLYRDEAPPARTDPALPPARSAGALAKERDHETPEGLPVGSFRTLLAELATLTRNRVVPAGADERAAFELLSEPNPLQARAFELIGVSPGSM